MSDLRKGDWVLIRGFKPIIWLKLAEVTPSQVTVYLPDGTTATYPRRAVYAIADAETLE